MLDHRNITAGFPKDAQRMLLPQGRFSRFIEYLDSNPADILSHPFIEDGGEKITEKFSRDAAQAYACPGVCQRLDERQKPQVLGFDLLEEPVYLVGVPHIFCMHHA